MTLDEKLDYLINKILSIELDIAEIKISQERILNHITFVEKTYNVIRTPLNFIKNKIENMSGNKNLNELPLIDSK